MATAELDIRIRAGDVPNATRELQRLERQGATTERGIAGLTSGFGKLASAAAGLASISAAMNKLVSTARQFDQLNAGLLTMTGSSENAAIAFAELEKFAAKTPYTLDQSVQGFTKLVALGLNPSQRAMESYGNTAAAMGKDLSQMIEAVADAATGEFERLKELAIKSKQQGDKVSFTFQGVTTTVGKNAAEIEGYLQSLGENQFAGAMANRMNTLDGALSNLQDSWDSLFRAISQAGTGEVIEDSVRVAISALDELNASISSGQTMAYIDAWGGSWEQTFDDVANMLELLDKYFSDSMESWGGEAKSTSKFMSDAFWEFPANIRALIQIATTHIAGFVDKAKAYGAVASEALNPFSDGGWSANLQLELAEIDHNVATLSASYLEQRNAAVSSLNDQTEAARNLREEYDKRRQKSGIDLGSFTKAGDSKDGEGGVDKEAEKLASKREMQLQSAQAWLERANQLGATELEQIDYWHQQELAKLREFEQQKALTAMEVDTARKALDEESARRRIELEDKVLQKSLEASRLKAQAEKQATTQMASMQWGLASQSLDAISMAAEEGSTMQKAAFVAGKGMAAAQAIMQAELASVSTLAAYAAAAAAAGPGGPALLAAGTAQAAAMKTMGYASAAIIAAQGFAGMFDNGGNIGSGQWGIVGENGPEIVKGPANVTSRKKTAALAASAVGGADGGTVVNNYITQNIQGNSDAVLAELVDRATRNALNETQADFAKNGRLRKTLGV